MPILGQYLREDNNNTQDDSDTKNNAEEDEGASSVSTLTDHATPLAQVVPVAEQDACWDGCWFADGLNGMFLALYQRKNNNPPHR